jgi:hypothetical protein
MDSCASKSAPDDFASSLVPSSITCFGFIRDGIARQLATLSTLCGMNAMRFSWTSLILAPLLVPVIFSATFIILAEGEGDPLPAFLAVLVAGCIVSYASTILLFLPCLFLLSLEQQMTGFKVCLLGSALGALEFVSLTLIAWGNRDPDLPIKNFFVYCMAKSRVRTIRGENPVGWSRPFDDPKAAFLNSPAIPFADHAAPCRQALGGMLLHPLRELRRAHQTGLY